MMDEIYDLFLWDASLTNEAYDARVNRGLELARSVKHLYPFFQPILIRNSKSVWEPCARVLAERTNGELRPYLYKLFEWLQDQTWPGADIIRNRLLQFPFSELESTYNLCHITAERNNDEIWLEVLEDFKAEFH